MNKQNLINRSNIGANSCVLYRKCAFIYWVVCFLSFTLLFVVLETRQLLVPVPPEYWIFNMASLCYFLVLFHGSALFAISIWDSGSISRFLIFPLPADHSWHRNREEKAWRGLKTNTKGSAYFQEKGWQLFLFQQAKMLISVLVTWMIVDCNLAVRFLSSF